MICLINDLMMCLKTCVNLVALFRDLRSLNDALMQSLKTAVSLMMMPEVCHKWGLMICCSMGLMMSPAAG